MALPIIETGDIFLKDLEYPSAILCYKKALTYPLEKKSHIRVLNNLAVAYKRAKLYEDAFAILKVGLSHDDAYVPFYSNLASLYRLHNAHQKAADMLQKAIALGHQLSDYLALIDLLRHLHQFSDALQIASSMVRDFPNEYEAHLIVGNLYTSIKNYPHALIAYQKAIAIDPSKTQAYNNIGVAYKELGESDNALRAYENVLRINPKDAAAFNNLGNLWRSLGQTDKALVSLKQAIVLQPDFADAYSNIGAIYKEKKNYALAMPYYQKALALNPNHTNANFDVALIELSLGNYRGGWKRYEHRLKMSELLVKTQPYKTPMWQGQSLVGKTLLLQNEQGYGDNIMFIRYAPLLAKLGARVLVRTRTELMELFRSIPAIEAIYSEEEAIPEHDYYLPLLSAPFYLGTTCETIPSTFPYLMSSQKYSYDFEPTHYHIGLVWSGSNTHKGHHERYVGLERFKDLLDCEGIVWHSLQVGQDADEIKQQGLEEKIIDHSAELTTFAKTASLINHLDMVITTDTSVAHLCGALDKKGFVLVPHPADWRWGQEGDTAPWYRSLTLLRQEEHGNWNTVMMKLKAQLEQLREGRETLGGRC